jgi:hypothetical protein
MHATLRRLKCAPGQAQEVGRLIDAEYIPQLVDVEGVVSYTLVDLGDDVVTSLGVFTTEAGAVQANALAQAWARARLADLGVAPLEAAEGAVLMHSIFPA